MIYSLELKYQFDMLNQDLVTKILKRVFVFFNKLYQTLYKSDN